jgi:DNA (cytosine-5)-methyltransferase 1
MRDINSYPIPVGYRWINGKVVDNFAGGGGASTGIAQANGRSPDIAVNHNAEALMMHEQNHPETKHYNESVWDIDILAALNGQPALMGWFSPDCTHFSVAKGGKPVKKAIRGLAWIVKKWIGQSDMAMLFMENVKEFMTWGPLIAKRCKSTGRVIKLVADPVKKDKDGNPVMNEVVSEPGEQVAYWDQALVPDKKRSGSIFKQFIKQLRAAGYTVEWKEKGLNACDYGDPTTRNRFFLMARKDGLPIIWPEPTHADKKYLRANPGKLQPWKTAGENLDFSLPCPSIFGRKKPLAEKTLARIFKGIEKFVIGAGDEAFLVKTNHAYDQFRGQSLDEPLQTLTSKLGTGLTAVTLSKFNQNSIGQSVDMPIDTVMAGATRFALVEAELQSAAAIMKFRGDSGGASCNMPLPVITAGGGAARPAGAPHALGVLQAQLEPLMQAGCITTIDHQSTGDTSKGYDEPLSVVTSKARHIQVAALLKHYTGVVGQHLDKPLPTITSKDHNSVMEATLAAVDPVHDLEDALDVAHIQRDFGNSVGHGADEPLGAITAGGGGKSALVASSLVKLKGTCNHGQSLDRPLDAIAAQGNHFAAVQAFLIKFYGTGGAVSCDEPLDTITAKARFGIVTIHGQDYQIVDIGMRMLEPHELYRCQGFPADYEHEVVMGKKLPKHAQVRMVGNSVPPGLARALVAANIPRWALGNQMQESA